MSFLYNIAAHTLSGGMRLLAPFNKKIKLGHEGRRDIFRRMAEAIDTDAPLAWFHAASLGEFEQGRPVIEGFRKRCPEYKVLVTFFSPSGYEIRKNYNGADYIFYLPTDTPRNVSRFMEIAHPKVAVFIKYEFWINYLDALQKSGAKVFIISSIFRPEQVFFKWYGGMFRRVLKAFTHIFVQNETSRELLKGIGITNVTVAGDTRFDRVYSVAHTPKEMPQIEAFTTGRDTFIAGSTWPADEQLLLQLINDNPKVKFIIAPHEIDPARIDRMAEKIVGGALRYTRLSADSDLAAAQVLFIDTIGMLSFIYRYGRWAYIGGGFGVGIHNTLEAATFGLPLAFGPRYEKFKEARDLIADGGAVSICDYEGLSKWFSTMKDTAAACEQSSKICKGYVERERGATELILSEICK